MARSWKISSLQIFQTQISLSHFIINCTIVLRFFENQRTLTWKMKTACLIFLWEHALVCELVSTLFKIRVIHLLGRMICVHELNKCMIATKYALWVMWMCHWREHHRHSLYLRSPLGRRILAFVWSAGCLLSNPRISGIFL